MFTRNAVGFVSARCRASSPVVSAERVQRDGVAFRQHPVELGEREDALDPGFGVARAAVGGEDAAAERRRAPRHLAPDPAKPDDAQG